MKITNSEEFAKACREEKDAMLMRYFDGSDAFVSGQIDKLELSDDKKEILKNTFDSVLTDTFYSILMAVAGESALGSAEQMLFKVISAEGFGISTNGELADAAYMAFYGDAE